MLDFGFYNMDCMEGMRHFPDEYFDLAVVDPPYGDASENRGGGTGSAKGSIATSIHRQSANSKDPITGKWCVANWRRMGVEMGSDKKIISWDVAPGQEYFDELFRVSRNQVIWGGNYFNLPATRCFLIWRKTNVPENFTMAMAEYAWTSFNDNAKWFEYSAVGQSGRFHPTQKPVELYKWILSKYAKPGYKILDTHVGSASSLIACHECGMKYVGFEIDKYYYEKAKKRLEEAEAQMTLFEFGFNPYQE